MMADAGTWGTLCGFFSLAVTSTALLCCPCCLEPPLPLLLCSPQEGERAVRVALYLRRLLWLWSHSGGHGLVVR